MSYTKHCSVGDVTAVDGMRLVPRENWQLSWSQATRVDHAERERLPVYYVAAPFC